MNLPNNIHIMDMYFYKEDSIETISNMIATQYPQYVISGPLLVKNLPTGKLVEATLTFDEDRYTASKYNI